MGSGQDSDAFPGRSASVDLAAVVLWTGLVIIVALLPSTRGTAIAFVLGMPLVLFLPGYALLAALYPAAGSRDRGDRSSRGIDLTTRLGLAVPVSLAVVILAIAPLAWTPWGFGPVPILVVLSLVTVCCVLIAAIRRQFRDDRFRFPPDRWRTTSTRIHSAGGLQTGIILVLFGSILLAAVTITFALAMPPAGEGSTQLYLGTMTDDGELIASDYPREFVAGEPESLAVGVENNHEVTRSYTVVIVLEVLAVDETDTVVTDQSILETIDTGDLDPDETWEHEHAIEIDRDEPSLRLSYYLYDAPPPDDPDPETAAEWVYLNVNVES